MTTLEMVKNAEKAMNEGFAKKWKLMEKIIAKAEAEGRYYYERGAKEHTFTKEENRAIIEINLENTVLYNTWKNLKNQRAREMRRARVEG